jgi:hypothetical protein
VKQQQLIAMVRIHSIAVCRHATSISPRKYGLARRMNWVGILYCAEWCIKIWYHLGHLYTGMLILDFKDYRLLTRVLILDLQVADTVLMIGPMLGLWRRIISTFLSYPMGISSIRCCVRLWNGVWGQLWSVMSRRYRTISDTKLLLTWEEHMPGGR